MSEKTKAQRLADWLDGHDGALWVTEAADELRRLEAENARMRSELERPMSSEATVLMHDNARLRAEVQALRGAVPADYVLVPRNPDESMIAAAESVEDLYRRGTPRTWVKVYRAMLAAAPQPAAQPTERCQYCDGAGDVHSTTGEWRGPCVCEAGKQAAQQEPFAYYNPAAKEIVMEAGQRDRYAKRTDGKGVGDYSRACTEPLYTRPAVPLTIAEVEQILAQWDYDTHGDRARYIVRMTEQAHKIGGAE